MSQPTLDLYDLGNLHLIMVQGGTPMIYMIWDVFLGSGLYSKDLARHIISAGAGSRS